MFFDNINQIEKLAKKAGSSIFVIPSGTEIKIKNAKTVHPGEIKTGIVIEQIREILEHLNMVQNVSQFIIIYDADTMNLNAANAFLKSLEEPKDNYHFILQTENPSLLPETILSRSEIYVLKQENQLESGISADEKIKELAKKLITASGKDYINVMNEITKKKDGTREYTLLILKTAIEICYKSYFKTNNQMFIKKIPNLIKAYENISANGHIKLHLVADML